ncbi:MAG: hypothetical protein Kow0029_18150 [Candidatus Rifleibacteriota bacterium]
MKRFYIVLSLFAFIFCAASSFILEAKPASTRVFMDTGLYGAVSTGHPLATAEACKILKNGGNAVDAAVCAAFMLGVVDFTNSGLGGDGFALVHFPDGSIIAIDGSTKRPFVKGKKPCDIGIPAAPELLLKLLRTFGNCSRAEIISPAIRTCLKGFKVSSYLSNVISRRLMKMTDQAAIIFLAPDGFALQPGQVLRQPALAKTLQQLVIDGGKSFYNGPIAEKLVEEMRANGSSYGRVDMSKVHSTFSLPFRKNWKNYELFGTPPPSSSVVAIKFALELLKMPGSLMNLSNSEKATIGETGRKILDFKYNFLSRYLYKPDLFPGDCLGVSQAVNQPEAKEDDSHTTHLCVWDKDGMAVSMTLTLGSHCGSGYYSSCGFFFNNEMRNFTSHVASYSQDYPDNAGPISSKSPIMIKRNGKLFSILGGAGSDRIIFNVGLAAARLLKGNSLDNNFVCMPRFFKDYKGVLQLEWNPQLAKTDSNNHVNVRQSGDDYFGLLSMIAKEDTKLFAYGDFRRDGDCRAIKEDPSRERQYHIRLYYNRNRGTDFLKLSGPISDKTQQAGQWKIPREASSKKIGTKTAVSFPIKCQTAQFSQNVQIIPQARTSIKQLLDPIKLKKDADMRARFDTAVIEFAKRFSDCKDAYELTQALMMEIGFSIPYKKVKKRTSAKKLLEKGYGDCSGKARLMSEVLNFYGIENRLVGGLICKNGLKSSTHLWVEIRAGDSWVPVCPVNQYLGHIPSNWIKFRYGESQTVSPQGKLIFSIKERVKNHAKSWNSMPHHSPCFAVPVPAARGNQNY